MKNSEKSVTEKDSLLDFLEKQADSIEERPLTKIAINPKKNPYDLRQKRELNLPTFSDEAQKTFATKSETGAKKMNCEVDKIQDYKIARSFSL